jgi:hypothetical protein
MQKDKEYNSAREAQHMCEEYASAYYDTMITGIVGDNPEFFDDF